jgi:hypothetical protein
MQVSVHFILQEFVPKVIFDKWGEKSIQFIDFRIVEFAELLRQNMARSLIINNWHKGGTYQESGLRTFTTKTGASMSQHKFGRAIDVKLLDDVGNIHKNSGAILRTHVFENWELYKHLITTTEADTDTWAHFDCRYTGMEKILVVPIPQ